MNWNPTQSDKVIFTKIRLPLNWLASSLGLRICAFALFPIQQGISNLKDYGGGGGYHMKCGTEFLAT